jgi:hypothetical protein
VLLDLQYATPERLQIGDATNLLEQFGPIGVYRVHSRASTVEGNLGAPLLAHSG